MKKVKNCIVENCIPTPSSCVTWNGGEIEWLGVCNGDDLNTLMWDIINKLEDLAGDEISNFDIDALIDICNQKQPLEINLISILTLLRDNQVCLKDYIDTLNEKINEISQEQGVDVNLKCYADFDNLGNSLSINRAELDQLIIDQLCNHKGRIETLEGKIINLQEQIDNLDNTALVEELNFSTCIDPVVRPTSSQVKNISTALCELRDATGTASAIAIALSKVDPNWNTKFGTLTGWLNTPVNWAENYGNLLLAFANLLARIETIEQNCCALTCDDIKLGFTALMNEDGTGVIIRFTFGAGTVIPAGFEDKGSKGTIKDKDGNIIDFNLEIGNNSETEVILTGLNLTDDVEINITAVLGTDGLTCQKCLSKTIKLSSSNCCVLTNSGSETVTIVYETTI